MHKYKLATPSPRGLAQDLGDTIYHAFPHSLYNIRTSKCFGRLQPNAGRSTRHQRCLARQARGLLNRHFSIYIYTNS